MHHRSTVLPFPRLSSAVQTEYGEPLLHRWSDRLFEVNQGAALEWVSEKKGKRFLQLYTAITLFS